MFLKQQKNMDQSKTGVSQQSLHSVQDLMIPTNIASKLHTFQQPVIPFSTSSMWQMQTLSVLM